jgi:hypothetical protein
VNLSIVFEIEASQTIREDRSDETLEHALRVVVQCSQDRPQAVGSPGSSDDSPELVQQQVGGDDDVPVTLERHRLLQIGSDLALQHGPGNRLLEWNRRTDPVGVGDALDLSLGPYAFIERQSGLGARSHDPRTDQEWDADQPPPSRTRHGSPHAPPPVRALSPIYREVGTDPRIKPRGPRSGPLASRRQRSHNIHGARAEEILARTPSPDTFSLPVSDQEFFFRIPFDQLDLLLYAWEHDVPPAEAATVLELDEPAVVRVYQDFTAKNRATRHLREMPHTI